MELSHINDDYKMESIYILTIPYSEQVTLKLDKGDRLLINECEKSKKISDKLLALEMLARRIDVPD